MNKKYAVTLTAILGLFSTNLVFTNVAFAQMSSETEQLLGEVDDAIEGGYKLLNTWEIQRQQEMNALRSACNSGNSQACFEYQSRLNAEDRAIDNAIETSRNRRLCGSPVCY